MATDEQIDFVYSEVEGLLQAGDFQILDDFLKWYATGEMSTDEDRYLAFLTASLPAKSKLPSRPAFFKMCQGIFPPDVLQGLE